MQNPIPNDDIRKPFSFYGHGCSEASTTNVKKTRAEWGFKKFVRCRKQLIGLIGCRK